MAVLGEMMLVGIPPRPEGASKILVAFDIDGDGVLHVGASLMIALGGNGIMSQKIDILLK